MHRVGRFTGVALAITLLAILALAASAGAQEVHSSKVELTPIRGSGVSGTATLKDVNGGMEVALNVQGLPDPGVKHINHIHAGGTCADVQAGRMPPVTIPLKTIVTQQDGTGSATTFVRGVSLDQIFSKYKKRLIIVHAESKKGGGIPPGITCADLVQTAANGSHLRDQTTMMSETTMVGETTMVVGEVPASGGPSILLPVAALLLGAGVLSYAVFRRRM
jgi:Cu/Zn superoxide dismutase